MNIYDLDEMQGIDSEKIAAWLRRNGWTHMATKAFQLARDPAVIGHRFTKGDASVFTGQDYMSLIFTVATAEGMSQQSLIRQINPRLHPWPSEAARKAHQGFWLAIDPRDGAAIMGMFRPDVPWFQHSKKYIITEEDSYARFWPCDEYAQRVRWPTDGQGVML